MSNPLTNIIQNIKTTLETTTKEISTDEGDNESISIFNEDDNTTLAELINCSAVLPIAILPGTIIDLLDGKSKDGQIGDTEQHLTGDCWLLSGVNALSYTEKGREIIKNALDYQDGYTIVHLATGDVTVSDIEVTTTKGSLQYSSGDDDMIIFELAIEKTIDAIINGEIELDGDVPWFLINDGTIQDGNSTTIWNSSVGGGFISECIYFLTGIEGTCTSNKDKMNNELDKFMENNGKDYVLGALISSGDGNPVYAEDIYGHEIKMASNHAYAIKSVDEDTVTVINPWDSSKEIVLSRETFLEAFTDTESVDLSSLDSLDSSDSSDSLDSSEILEKLKEAIKQKINSTTDQEITYDEAKVYAEGEAEIDKMIKTRTALIMGVMTDDDYEDMKEECRNKYMKEHPEYAAVMEKGQAIEEAFETAMTNAAKQWVKENPEPNYGPGIGESFEHKEWAKAKEEYIEQQKAEYISNNPSYSLIDQCNQNIEKDKSFLEKLIGWHEDI